MSVVITVIATLAVGILYASVFEWTLHKYLMHRPLGNFRYPFEAHTLTHHRLFKADHSYHLQEGVERRKIRMAWWNGSVLVLMVTTPFAFVALLLRGIIGLYEAGAVLATGFSVAACYYLAYEYLHWCMHLPRKRNVERTGLFFRLNGHHILHHRYMNKNFNVVFPLADLCFGTLLTRSKVVFKQVTGKMVPDLQPKETACKTIVLQ